MKNRIQNCWFSGHNRDGTFPDQDGTFIMENWVCLGPEYSGVMPLRMRAARWLLKPWFKKTEELRLENSNV